MTEKEYLIGELEKKISDFQYYEHLGKQKKLKALNDTSALLRRLKKLRNEMSEKEQAIVPKALTFIQRLKKVIK